MRVLETMTMAGVQTMHRDGRESTAFLEGHEVGR